MALRLPLSGAVGVLVMHEQLAPVAWAFHQEAPGRRLGFVQTPTGGLPGGHCEVVTDLRERGLLAGQMAVGTTSLGGGEVITTAGAIHRGSADLGWDAVVCGPGPETVSSGSELRPAAMAALDSAHTARALGCSTLLVAHMSSRDPLAHRRTISHDTLTVLDLLLEPVTVALPAGMRSPVGSDLRAGLGALFGASRPAGWLGLSFDVDRPVRITRHDWRRARIDLPAYSASGLPVWSTGATIVEDPLFFGASLAAGTVLAQMCGEGRPPTAVDDEGHPGQETHVRIASGGQRAS